MCFDVTMKCELMALVKAQVKALDFKTNQKRQLCLTASLHRMRTAVSSACLATASGHVDGVDTGVCSLPSHADKFRH